MTRKVAKPEPGSESRFVPGTQRGSKEERDGMAHVTFPGGTPFVERPDIKTDGASKPLKRMG